MHHLGISVYPEHSTPEKDEAYLKLAEKYGFTQLFTCFLSVNKSPDETEREFGAFISKAHEHGFSVAVDTNPHVFEHLGASAYDLSPFARMAVDTVRLDGHLGDEGDIAITHNPYGIKVQFNASSSLPLDLLVERGADPDNMCVCHNFFPEKLTGLSEARFMELSERYHNLGLRTAAFVSSREENTFGPWNVYDGLPTCEADRMRPIDLQLRHLLATGLIDDVLIGNAYASESELDVLEKTDRTKVTFRIVLDPGATKIELDDLKNHYHTTRTDASEWMLRSSWPRLDYVNTSIPARPTGSCVIPRGSVLVVNDNLAHYRGEVEVALRDFEDDGTRNIVGSIPPEELFLLDYVKPEHAFGFIL